MGLKLADFYHSQSELVKRYQKSYHNILLDKNFGVQAWELECYSVNKKFHHTFFMTSQ